MDMMAIRRSLLMQVPPAPVGKTLIHDYIYGSAPYDFGGGVIGFKDQIGTYDLHTNNGISSWIKGDTNNTDSARASWGLYPGDAWEMEITGLTRATRYPISQGFSIYLSGINTQNGTSLGRNSNCRIYNILQGGAVSNVNPAPLRLRYYKKTTDTTVDSSNTFMGTNGTPCKVTLSYANGICIGSVDDVEFLRFEDSENASLYHIDGIAIGEANLVANAYWHFDEIKVYKN